MTDVARRLSEIEDRIAKAAAVTKRSPDDVTLIAVTKGRLADEVAPLIAAGARDFGESRVQEAATKWPALRTSGDGIRLHCIGRLQSNKAEDAVALFDVVHSLDRASLLEALAAASAKTGRTPTVYVQVNIGDEPQKGGCPIADLAPFLAAVRQSSLPLAGLMCIPPAGVEPGPYFALLAELGRRHDVNGLSMGMSADFQTAVMLGATAVRVGSALFEDQ